MKYYENLAEMYVGDDVSPDFYGGWGGRGPAHVPCTATSLAQRWVACTQPCLLSPSLALSSRCPPACAPAGWVFPKYDHVAVGTGTVINKTSIKQYQQVRGCCARGSAACSTG